jgi:hypothetical protein
MVGAWPVRSHGKEFMHARRLSAAQINEEWRRNGYRLQLVSRYLFSRLGLKVLKGEEQSWDSIGPNRNQTAKLARLSNYLRDWSDYIVSDKGKCVIVDVKAPARLRFLPWPGPFGKTAITFSMREWDEYRAAPVPVRVFVWDYDGAESLDRQKKLLYYTIVDFASLSQPRELAETREAKFQPVGCRRLTPRVFRRFLRRCRAMDVVGISPGMIKYS